MACQAMHFWTISGLVGAFLDLAIAYLLLCASTIAFFASKFLGFFGLDLPCPCNGLFGNPNRNYCLQSLLVDSPTETVSSVQFLVKSKFPFDSILAKDPNFHLNMKLIKDGNNSVDGFVELEGNGSCSLISDARNSQNDVGCSVMSSPVVKERRFDLKGKGVVNQRPRIGIRRRRKGAVDCRKFSSVSSYDSLCADLQDAPLSACSINEEQNETIECSSMPVYYGGEAPMVMRLGERAFRDFELNQIVDEKIPTEKNASVDELRSSAEGELGFDGDEKHAIRVLEQALEEEHAARAALYLELEKERNAAASAADEAMAMILRLQEEKACIEMEARQYQRIIEEKSAYDAEEMNILKEILFRREREKHFLEKEVEAYRQIIYLGNEQLEGDVHSVEDTERQPLASSLDLTEDPVLMLNELSKSIDKKEMVKSRSPDKEVASIDSKNCTVAVGNELPIRGWEEDADLSYISKYGNNGNPELWEKKMVSMDNDLCAQPREEQIFDIYLQSYNLSSSQDHNSTEKTIAIVGEEQEQNGNANLCQGLATKTVKTYNGTEVHTRYEGQNLEKHGNDAYQASKAPCNLMFDKEAHVHDVHVIDDESNFSNEASGNQSEQLAVDDTLKVHRIGNLPFEVSLKEIIDVKRDCPSTSRLATEMDINRSSSDMTIGLPPMGSRSRAVLCDLRRNSTSALDCERSKIDTEVEQLRERLRIVQEGREKLSLTVEHQEREKLQLQLLEDIAHQLREIRQLTEPGKAVRQASLPPPSSKVLSKKRRCRSVSLGVNKGS